MLRIASAAKPLLLAALAMLSIVPYPPPVSNDDNPVGPLVKFRTNDVLPPAAVYVGPGDGIQIIVRNPSFPATLFIQYRLLLPDGEIKVSTFQQNFATVGNAAAVAVLPPTEGYLLSMEAAVGGAQRGQFWLRVFIAQGASTPNSAATQILMQGYVGQDDRLGYPGSITESCTSGRGWIRPINIADPAVQTDWVLAVPVGVRWVLKAVQYQLITDATVGNRATVLNLSMVGFTVPLQYTPPRVTVANSGDIYQYGDGYAFASFLSVSQTPIASNLILPATSTLSSSTAFVGPADRIRNILVFVEEWVSI